MDAFPQQGSFENLPAARLAAGWFFVFAGFHLLWTCGFYIGLPAALARHAFQRPWFQTYNVVATVTCVIGGGLSVWLAQPPKQTLLRKLLLYGGGLCAALLLLRSGGAVLQMMYLLLAQKARFSVMLLWDLWFCIGTLLFLVAFNRYRKVLKSMEWREQFSLRK